VSRRHPVACLILVVAVVCAVLAARTDRASAQATGGAFAVDNAVVVHPDYDAREITITVAMAFYSRSCPAGTSCAVSPADVARIIAAIELYWNGFNYKCFKVVVRVTPRTVQSQADAGPDEVDVGLDSTPVSGIRSYVRAEGNPDQYQSDDPAARVRPQHDPSHATTWAAQTEFPAIWAHEFGHILGLQENYDPNDNRQVLPGASEDLMFASRFGVVSQEMIDRVVRRSGQVDEQKMKCGYQFVLSWTGDGIKDDLLWTPLHVTYDAWGLICPESAEWKIWEIYESDHSYSAATGPPGADPLGPMLATFGPDGVMNGITWPGLGISLDGKTGAGAWFSLSPPQGPPTSVTAMVPIGASSYTVSAPIEKMDGSFGAC